MVDSPFVQEGARRESVERATAARALYAAAGFKPYAREVDAFRQSGKSDTLEFFGLELGDPR